MKLWADGKNGSSGSAIRATIKEQVSDINHKVISRGVRAVNAIRNAELEVLKGQRSGKVYRKPFTKHATYTASAPGESPARRTGNLRMNWNGQVRSENSSNGGVAIVGRTGKSGIICCSPGKWNVQHGSQTVCGENQGEGCARNPEDLQRALHIGRRAIWHW